MMTPADWEAFFEKLERELPGPEYAFDRERRTRFQMTKDHLDGLIESGRYTKQEIIDKIDEHLNRNQNGGAIIID